MSPAMTSARRGGKAAYPNQSCFLLSSYRDKDRSVGLRREIGHMQADVNLPYHDQKAIMKPNLNSILIKVELPQV
jgi:hypothetical protein